MRAVVVLRGGRDGARQWEPRGQPSVNDKAMKKRRYGTADIPMCFEERTSRRHHITRRLFLAAQGCRHISQEERPRCPRAPRKSIAESVSWALRDRKLRRLPTPGV